MQVDLILSNAKVFDVTRMQLVKGQAFQLAADGPGKWLSDNDPILTLDIPKNNTSAGVAAEIGTSVIWIFDDNKRIIKELTISVVESIEPQATKLNLSADEK